METIERVRQFLAGILKKRWLLLGILPLWIVPFSLLRTLDKDGKESWAGTFEIDPTASPKVWDHRSHDAKKTGTDVLGIYELDGDKLKVACVVGQWKGKEWTGKPRPRTIDPKEADVVIELKRVVPGK